MAVPYISALRGIRVLTAEGALSTAAPPVNAEACFALVHAPSWSATAAAYENQQVCDESNVSEDEEHAEVSYAGVTQPDDEGPLDFLCL